MCFSVLLTGALYDGNFSKATPCVRPASSPELYRLSVSLVCLAKHRETVEFGSLAKPKSDGEIPHPAPPFQHSCQLLQMLVRMGFSLSVVCVSVWEGGG